MAYATHLKFVQHVDLHICIDRYILFLNFFTSSPPLLWHCMSLFCVVVVAYMEISTILFYCAEVFVRYVLQCILQQS